MRVTLATLLISLSTLIQGSSQRPKTLHQRAIDHPKQIQTRSIKRNSQLQTRPISSYEDDQNAIPNWSDSFLLSFNSHNIPITISLRPTTTLIHKDGIKQTHIHTASDGTRETIESVLKRENIRVYEGVVLSREEMDMDRWIKEEETGIVRDIYNEGQGHAKIVITPGQDDQVEFRGSFTLGEESFTIHSTPFYLATKDHLDPEPLYVLNKRSGIFTHPPMVIVREADILTPQEQVNELRRRGVAVPEWSSIAPSSCGHDHIEYNIDPNHPIYQSGFEQASFGSMSTPWSISKFGMPVIAREGSFEDTASFRPRPKFIRRQGDISGSGGTSSNFINSIGSTIGCPKSAMLVTIGVAADCTYTQTYQSSDQARTQILTDFNSASSIYSSTFNISLGISELIVQSGNCPTTSAGVDTNNPWNLPCQEFGSLGVDLNERLSIFSEWRGNKGGDGVGLWHLLSNCSTGSEVGVAWLGQLCRVESSETTDSTGQKSFTSGTAVTTVTRSTSQVIAHEIGHNFG